MTSKHSVVIVEPVRTAIGTFGGTLKDIPAVELGAAAINAALQRSNLRPDEIGTVVMGNTVQAGNKMNPARQAAIHGGLPVQVPAMTVNRVCGSGAQAIVSAAHEILMGSVDAAIAGGMENMDAAPYLVAHGRWGHRLGDGSIYDSVLRDGLNDAFSDAHSGWHTEDLVTKFQISRAQQDEWALRSHRRFSAAQSAGKFDGEIVPVEVRVRKGPSTFRVDEHNRPDATIEALAKLKPGFPRWRYDHRRQCAGLEYGRCGDGAGRRGLGGQTRSVADCPTGVVRHRCGGTGHVRARPDPRRQTGAGARRLEQW
ncbi:acetyl-CoA acetyltransferase family protein [Bradyrhizobium sp. JR3.5]